MPGQNQMCYDFNIFKKNIVPMKNIIVAVFWIFSFLLMHAQSTSRDTVFLLKRPAGHGSVFIDPGLSPVLYENFKLRIGTRDSLHIAEAVAYYNSTRPLTKNKLQGLPTRWCPLYLYKNSYYVYQYADGTCRNLEINDSLILMSGSNSPARLNAVEKLNANVYRIVTSEKKDRNDTILIHMVDPRGIAVFETPEKDVKNKYFLMVRADAVNLFPIVINQAGDGEGEFDGWQKPDYKKLIK